MPDIGFIWLPRSVHEAVAIARGVEAGGFWGLGISDSPVLYQEMYPVVSACLAATEHIKVGSNVTNPVSRHWTIHASSARAYEELHPERYYLGLASGDGAVHSIGRRPATLGHLARAVDDMRGAIPDTTEIQVAASGPRAAAMAGSVADSVILGTGAEPAAVAELGGLARASAAERGKRAPRIWGLIPTYIVDDDADLAQARRDYAAIPVAYARFAFDVTFASKHIPTELQAPLRAGLDRYDFGHHATVGVPNPNAHLFDDTPEVLDYLFERMVLFGTREQCATRLERFLDTADVDGVHLTIIAPDPVKVVERAGDAFAHLVG
ncbi:MAG: LLM class flavin-dependent oxidoreductase [Acidimicrobiales bacterium]|nr:LLM class flavin-dependent oxidoreductase [Acidimicrobiales bacterium]